MPKQKWSGKIWILLAESFPMVASKVSQPIWFVCKLITRVRPQEKQSSCILNLLKSVFDKTTSAKQIGSRDVWLAVSDQNRLTSRRKRIALDLVQPIFQPNLAECTSGQEYDCDCWS